MADPLCKLRLSFKKCLVSACCCNPVLRARDTLRKETWPLAWENSNQGIVNAYWVTHVTREAWLPRGCKEQKGQRNPSIKDWAAIVDSPRDRWEKMGGWPASLSFSPIWPELSHPACPQSSLQSGRAEVVHPAWQMREMRPTAVVCPKWHSELVGEKRQASWLLFFLLDCSDFRPQKRKSKTWDWGRIKTSRFL